MTVPRGMAGILQDVPIYGGGIKGELCTPTGAALLKHFTAQFGDMSIMRVHAIGYGMGAKDFARIAKEKGIGMEKVKKLIASFCLF